jgi:flagellar biosynthesis/type III secretory pathway protein FliH
MRFRNILPVFMVIVFVVAFSSAVWAQENDSRDILREGLVGTESSTASSEPEPVDVADTTAGVSNEAAMPEPQEAAAEPMPTTQERWRKALEGAGLRVTDTSLVDMLSGERVANVQQVDQMTPRDAYSDGYMEGYRNGYKSGYTEGYKDGIKDASGKQK